MDKLGIDRKILAENGVKIFLDQVFRDNFFHADMHPGNIFVSKVNVSQPSYIAIDCAIVGSLSREDQYNLARMLQATLKQDYYKFSISLSLEFIEKKSSTDIKTYNVNTKEYGEIVGSFAINDQDNLDINLMHKSLESVSSKLLEIN